MDLIEYVLTYREKQADGTEKIVANIPDYYDKVIHNLDPKYMGRSLHVNRTVICPLHEDNDPSLGLMNHRHLKDVKLYHCFGCNSTGTIIRLHQRIVSKYEKRNITDEESCKELATIFNIPLENFSETSEEDFEKRYMMKMKDIDSHMHDYTSRDYSNEILALRKESKIVDLKKLNKASIKMIATQKKLYN